MIQWEILCIQILKQLPTVTWAGAQRWLHRWVVATPPACTCGTGELCDSPGNPTKGVNFKFDYDQESFKNRNNSRIPIYKWSRRCCLLHKERRQISWDCPFKAKILSFPHKRTNIGAFRRSKDMRSFITMKIQRILHIKVWRKVFKV